MYSGWAFIDVDGTLIDANDNPRPYIKELFQGLKDLNLIVVVWSGGGKEYADLKVQSICNKTINWDLYNNIVNDFMWKGTQIAWDHINPVFFIDDAEGLLDYHSKLGAGGFKVPFYDSTIMENDNYLLLALEACKKYMSKYGKGGQRVVEKYTGPNSSLEDLFI